MTVRNSSQTMDWIKSLATDGYMPPFGEYTQANGQNSVADTELLGSSKVAMTMGGSWEVATFAKLTGITTGIAPTPIGPDGTRKVLSNSNGNTIWAGTKNPQLAWKWVSYMGSAQCQTMASEKNGSFFPSIASAMDAMSATSPSRASTSTCLPSTRSRTRSTARLPTRTGRPCRRPSSRCSTSSSTARRGTAYSPPCSPKPARSCPVRTSPVRGGSVTKWRRAPASAQVDGARPALSPKAAS